MLQFMVSQKVTAAELNNSKNKKKGFVQAKLRTSLGLIPRHFRKLLQRQHGFRTVLYHVRTKTLNKSGIHFKGKNICQHIQ